jgi:hypothetical protein
MQLQKKFKIQKVALVLILVLIAVAAAPAAPLVTSGGSTIHFDDN